jgi:hypothetical protein
MSTDQPNPESGFDAVPAPSRDWTEDFSHENGNYNCRCTHCGEMFVGHKRRVICKLCAALEPPPSEATPLTTAFHQSIDFTGTNGISDAYNAMLKHSQTLERAFSSSHREVAALRDKLDKALTRLKASDEELSATTREVAALKADVATQANSSVKFQTLLAHKTAEASELSAKLQSVERERDGYAERAQRFSGAGLDMLSSLNRVEKERDALFNAQSAWQLDHAKVVTERDASTARALAAEVSAAQMREILVRAKGLLRDCIFISDDISDALASTTGQPLLDRLVAAEKDKTRLDWLEANPHEFASCTWDNRGRCWNFGQIGITIGECRRTMREAIDAAIQRKDV